MTCSGPSNSTQYCGHVYEGGAENTIVRLPENVRAVKYVELFISDTIRFIVWKGPLCPHCVCH